MTADDESKAEQQQQGVHRITSRELGGTIVAFCWALGACSIAAGAAATFVTDNQAGSAALIALGCGLIYIAIVRRIPLRLEVGSTKLDATYERTDEAYDIGREAGVAQGLETAVDDVKQSIEKGEASDRLLEALNEQLERLNARSKAMLEDMARNAFAELVEENARSEDFGYRVPTAAFAAAITLRQVDYWKRTGLVEPSLEPEDDANGLALYSFRDILVLKIVKRLLDAGVSLQQIRVTVRHIYSRGDVDLKGVTILSDGQDVYEFSSPDEVVDLFQGGSAFFGISIDAVMRELETTLRQMPGERVRAVRRKGL